MRTTADIGSTNARFQSPRKPRRAGAKPAADGAASAVKADAAKGIGQRRSQAPARQDPFTAESLEQIVSKALIKELVAG